MAMLSRVDYNKLSPDCKVLYGFLKDQFVSLKNEITELSRIKDEEIDALKESLKEQKTMIDQLSAKNALLDKKVTSLENSLDDEDAYVRRETIIFNCSAIPPATPGEICNNVIKQVIKDKLKIQLQESDISVAHRAGKKPSTQAPDRRGIQVRFCRRDVKRQLMMTKKDNTDRSNTLFTNESLTPKRSKILFTLRQMRKKFPELIKGCTSQEGRVYAFTPAPSDVPTSRSRDRKHLVNSEEGLAEFSRKFIQMPLDQFLGGAYTPDF